MGIRQTGIPIGGDLASAALPFFFYQYGLASALFVQAIVATAGGIIFLLFYRDHNCNKQFGEKHSFMEKITRIKNNFELYPVFFIGLGG